MDEQEYWLYQAKDLKEWAEILASQWNGDNPGVIEDNAHLASRVMQNCDEIIKAISEMELE